MTVGLGTGSTAALFLSRARRTRGLGCAASPRRRRPRRRHAAGLAVEPFDRADALARLDLAVDGADQVAPRRLAREGRRRSAYAREDRRRGGRALRRDRLVGQARRRDRAPRSRSSSSSSGSRRRSRGSARPTLRDAPRTPDGGVIADWIGSAREPGRARRAPRGDARSRRARALPTRARLRGPRRPRRRRRAALGCASSCSPPRAHRASRRAPRPSRSALAGPTSPGS